MAAGPVGGMPPPEMSIKLLVVLVPAAAAAIYGLTQWIKEAKPKPDPWGPEVDAAIHGPDALPVCHHCFTPQEDPHWFCPECGAAVGPYNNLMPFLNLFSEGEVLRAGTSAHLRSSWLVTGGYLLLSLVAYHFIVAPVYWYFLFKNLRRPFPESDQDPGSPSEEPASAG